ncbi:MAG: hypothetical protein AB7U62_03030 [Pseudolabrys sp.]
MFALRPNGSYRAVNSEADLLPGEIFSEQRPVFPVNLTQYANDKQWHLATGGFTIEFNGGPTVTFATDTIGVAMLQMHAARQQQPAPPATVQWQIGETQFVDLTGQQVQVAFARVTDFINGTFDVLKPLLADIDTGRVRSVVEIDAYAWPSARVTVS